MLIFVTARYEFDQVRSGVTDSRLTVRLSTVKAGTKRMPLRSQRPNSGLRDY